MGGRERSRHIPFAPQAGRRCRQADEGLASAISWTKSSLTPSPEWPFLREMHSKDQTNAHSSSHHRPSHDRRRALGLPDDDAGGAAGGG
ncbi:hypothetical protein GFL91_27600 [Rhizobium leguminosarum bv. viciae]|uniref:Uncharacterized protein n=1 Tax=Rhizobium leguminosarum bv. viciae TaxID=387 RepID=A0A8I2GYV0_RHILV|nr:hypothetical protein [Rhizobium leguminosarum bv. viciae]